MLVLILAATMSPASPPAPAPATAAEGQALVGVSRATAAALAATVAPADLMIPMELDQARKAILALPTVDEDAKQLEQEFPGLYAALWAAAEPEMRRFSEADHPAYIAALEKLYMARLSEREAQALLTFYKSATGQKMLRTMFGSVDAIPMVSEMAKTDSWTVSEEQMKTVTQPAKAKALQQLGREDEAALLTLAASIDLQRVRAIGSETQQLTLEWVNKEDPEADEKLGKIMEEAMEKFMAAHPSTK